MRIVIAPDKFKGSLTAAQVGKHVAAGIREVAPDADVRLQAMADGGEGTVDAAVDAGFARRSATVTGPLGDPVTADFALRGTRAVIELAAASGLLLLEAGDRDALAAHTRGTGELMLAALAAGATSIVLAVGGSASTDGGSGMLRALGAEFLDDHGEPVADGGAGLAHVATANFSGLDPRLAHTELVLAADVDHVLHGPTGAAHVFAPQKGASAADVEILDAALAQYARVVARALPSAGLGEARSGSNPASPDTQRAPSAQHDPAALPGAGAAGGVGFAALAVLGAQRRPGAEVVAEVTKLAELVAGADLVITGEGSFDAQSLGGKTPMGVLSVARAASVPAVLVCGRSLLAADEIRAAGFVNGYAVADRAPDPDTSVREAGRYLTEIGREIAETELIGAARAR